jgi:multiple sugar transport system permease protein
MATAGTSGNAPGGTAGGRVASGAGTRRSRVRRWLGGNLYVLPVLVFMLAAMAYPLAYNLYLSLHRVAVGNFIRGDWPFAGLGNYTQVLGDATFRHSLGTSAVFTGGSLLFQFLIGFALALFFARPFPLGGALRALLLLGWMLPIVVSANIWRWLLAGDYSPGNHLLRGLGLLQDAPFWLSRPTSALVGVVAANVWVGIPFNMLLLLAGLQAIPVSLYEAAAVDGAGAWQRFWHITVPQLRPVALVVLLLGFIYTFKVFDLIFVMTGGGPVDATTVLPIQVYKLTFQFFRFGQGAAAATVLFAISLGLCMAYVWLLRREQRSA